MAKKILAPKRTGKTKSRSGCRTCKTRRVKCDEGKPACQRCVSTGWSCDGYGIWGGGATAPAGQVSIFEQERRVVPQQSLPFIRHSNDAEETGYFEWFRHRSMSKLPGVFHSSFWETLLLPATVSEPAVWHAVLAMSSAHKRECFNGEIKAGNTTSLDEQEKFALRHYSKAINSLVQSSPPARSRSSVRVALVTCLIFIYLEFLHGRYTTAQSHLANGLKLLRESEVEGYAIPREYADDAVKEAFSNLCFQVQLMMQTTEQPHLRLLVYNLKLPSSVFESIGEARQHLQHLFSEISQLSQQARQQSLTQASHFSLKLVDHQRRIRDNLAGWLAIYQASKPNFLIKTHIRGAFAYDVLYAYYPMACIMAHACLSPTDEWLYDSHTNDFVTMVLKIMFLRLSQPTVAVHVHGRHGEDSDKSKTIMDIGGIPPLYYTAIKCRNHRVRLQAIKLLESTGSLHKEGIWDSKIASCVARKVMEVEERGFYAGREVDDGFEFGSPMEERDFLVPVLPDEYRLHDVQVVLPDDPEGKILLSYRESPCDGLVVKREWQYELLPRRWTQRGETTLANGEKSEENFQL